MKIFWIIIIVSAILWGSAAYAFIQYDERHLAKEKAMKSTIDSLTKSDRQHLIAGDSICVMCKLVCKEKKK